MHSTPKKLPTAYLYCATLVTNTVIIFLLVNIVLASVYYVRDRLDSNQVPPAKDAARSDTAFFNKDGSPVDNGKRSPYDLDWFDFNAYENIDPNYAADVLDGFWLLRKMGFIYAPWMGFAEPRFTSKLVNVDVDPHGFPIRRTVNEHSRTDRTVFVFVMGGSPTFGYSVSDEHTWASQLSRLLNARAQADQLGINVEVVNYGKAFYYPSQETALLFDLLKSGQRPSLVVFMDGVNMGPSEDVPQFTEEMAREMNDMQFEPPVTEQFSWVPVVRLAEAVRRRLFQTDTTKEREPKAAELSRRVDHYVNMFDRNMEMSTVLADFYDVRTLFFLQPNVAYHYSKQLLRRPMSEELEKERDLIEMLYERLRFEPGRIDLSELFNEWGTGRKAIVDDCHYSPGFNEFLARYVADHIDLKTLVPRAQLLDESAASGEPRNSYFHRAH